MTACRIEQLEMIPTPPALFRTRLEAPDSPRKAYYEIAVYHLAGAGFLIVKSSGSQNAKPNTEIWFRAGLKAAMEKKKHLIDGKLYRKGKGRIYVKVAEVK
jgi:hypothetical protein